jgi:hypothetical protein
MFSDGKTVRLLDPLSRSSIMEELMFNKSAPFQSDPTSAGAADAAVYVQTNLISDVAGVGAQVTESYGRKLVTA